MPWTKLVADSSNSLEQQKKDFSKNERVITYGEAIKEAIFQSMYTDKNVIVLGEGVDTAGYIYDTTVGLSEKFGKDRVIETPIAESAMTGVTLGASITGLRPILIHMRNDFLLVSMDQIINHISHWKNLFGYNVPLVIRATIARGWGSGIQHSQSFQRLFSGFDGLDVVMPYTPYDAKGLFLSAVASNRPTLFLEHRWLYNDKGNVPEEPYFVKIGKSKVIKMGKDVTVIGMSLSNREIKNSMEFLNNKNIDIEWIDLRTVSPINYECICDSVKNTGRLLIVENGSVPNGIGAEIAAYVSDKCFEYLKAPIKRLGWKSSSIFAGVKYEEASYLKVDDIIKCIEGLVLRNAK